MSIKPIPQAVLGPNGPTIDRIGLGLMGLHFLYGPPTPDEQCFALLDHALEIGETFWDTSDVYNGNEAMIGRYFKARPGAREKVFLATKFGVFTEGGQLKTRTDKEYVHQAFNASLEKLGVDYVDLWYMHRVNPDTPIEETVRAMAEIKAAGKVKYLGLSEISAATLRRAWKIAPIHAVQQEYSLFTLDVEDPSINLLVTCREFGTALVAYSPLSRGFLTDTPRSIDDFDKTDFRRLLPRFQPGNFEKNVKAAEEIKAIAERKGITAGQLALAWLLAQGPDVFVIPGTKRTHILDENVGAGKVVLTEEEVKEVRAVVERAKPEGHRYGGKGGNEFGDTRE